MSLDRSLQVGGIVIGLIGGGLVVVYPTKWAGWSLVCVGLLILFGATVWAIAARYAITEYKATQPLPTTATKQELKVEKRAPVVFIPTANTRIAKYGFLVNSLTLEREPYGDHNLINVALAQFLYRPDEGVDSYVYVSAHLFLYKPDGTRLQPEIYYPVWDGDEPKPVKEFHVGRVHDLIIGLFSLIDADRIVLYEHDPSKDNSPWDVVFTPKAHEVEGDDFFVNVDLIIKLFGNEPLPKQSFWFRLTMEPKADLRAVDPPDFAA